MARIARAVVPHFPHHITQRGNRRQQTFFCNADYELYVALMHRWCREHGVGIWAYCLIPNHVHLVAVPEEENSLARAIGEAHRRYTQLVNAREGWRGHLWQGRFASYVMDERHLLTCVRYVETNPVRAGLVAEATEWRWSSASAHTVCRDDQLVTVRPMLEIVGPDWASFLNEGTTDEDQEVLREHERTGRPLGAPAFLDAVEGNLGRILKPRRAGRKRTRRPYRSRF